MTRLLRTDETCENSRKGVVDSGLQGCTVLLERDDAISLPDGRKLGYLIVGEGRPVFYFHGDPMSRLDVLLEKEMISKYHLQVIGVDRPGFGTSTYSPNRRASDFADDVRFLANHLGIDKFALLGVSGGGHYVITCAALFKERVTRAVVVSGASLPVDTKGMFRMNRIGFTVGTWPIVGTWFVGQQRNAILKMAKDPDAFMKSKSGERFLKNLPKEQEKFFQDPELRDLLCRTMAEAFRQGPDGVKALIHEVKLMKKGWEVDLTQIPYGIVYLWHGKTDTNVPVSNAYRNAKDIPGAHMEIFEGEGHTIVFNNAERLGEILSS